MKLKIIFSILLLTLLFDSALAGARIHGGCPVDIAKAPYMAHVTAAKQKPIPGKPVEAESCGGSILKTNLILTAAHCVKDSNTGEVYPPDRYFINVGANEVIIMGKGSHSVKHVHVHSKYGGGGDNHFSHDIALLELTDPITLDERTQLVNLTNKNDKPKPGTVGVVSGWGTNPDHPKDKRLYQVHLNVISAQSYHDQIAGGSVQEVEKHQICGQSTGKNFCKGDSGGPFIDTTTNRQIGVVSYGSTDCTNNTPSVFCRVSDNLDFIQKVIRKTRITSSMGLGSF